MGRPKKTLVPLNNSSVETAFSPALPDTVDRVNNQLQKETALHTVGATRQKAYQALADALQAEIVSTVLVDGEMVEVREPNHAVRTKASVDILKAFGDMKEFEAKTSVTHNKVIYQWLTATITPPGRLE